MQGNSEPLERYVDGIEEPPGETRLRRQVEVGFAVAVLLTGLLGFFSWLNERRAAEEADWVDHTHEVMTTLEATLRHLVDVETGGRGFALTGHEPFLAPYNEGKATVASDLQDLRLLLADNPGQERLLQVFKEQAKAKIQASDALVAARQQTGTIPTLELLERGKRIMDAARNTVEQMEAAETRLLEQRSQRAHATRSLTSVVTTLGAVLGMVFLTAAGFGVSREIGVSVRARAQVNALNADLERRVTERTAALVESEGRLSGVIQSAMDSIITVDEQQHIVLFNAAAEKMFRCPAAKALGRPVLQFIPQRFHDAHSGHIRKFGATGVTTRAMGEMGALWAVRGDGEEFQIEASISQVVTGGRKLFTVILRDVTERQRAEEVRERLAAVVESSEDAIIGKTLDGIIATWNRGAEKIFGYSAAEAVGRPMLMLFPPECVQEEAEILARVRQGISVEHFETVRIRKDGKRIDVSATISPIRDSSGAVVGASKIARDITERKQSEEALRQSDARRRFALETAKLGDWELDLTTLQATRSLLHDQIFGYQSLQAEWSFDVFLRHVHPDDREKVRENFETRASQGMRWEFECRIICASGDTRWIWACGDHYREGAGEATGMFGIVQDVTERKQAEEALREKEHLLSESQRIAHIGSWTLDMTNTTGQIVWSEELYRIYGVSPEMFTPTLESLVALIVPEDRVPMQKWIAACAAGRKPEDLEFRVSLPDGTIRFISGRGELQRDAQNRPVRMAGSAQDITERKQAEEALRESEERFQAMVNGIPQLAWMAEADGHIFWYNQRWYQYTGTTPKQMEGWGWQSVHDPEVLPKVLERWKGSIASGERFDMEFPLRAADGSFRMFLTGVMPVKDGDGRVTRWFGTNTDITERKQSEERLAEQAEELSRQAVELARSQEALEAQTRMLKLVLESMGEGLVAANREGRFLIWNDSARKLLGRGASHLPPEQWSSHYCCYLPDGITPCPMEGLPLVRALQGESVQMELMIQYPQREDGVFLEFTAQPMKDTEGRVCGGVVAFRDITERKAAEREIQELNRGLEARVAERTAQLAAANKELEAFTYSVSHDLRAPLRHMSGFTKILAEDFGSSLPAEAQQHLQRIQNGAHRMGQLVDELLNLTRVGRQTLAVQVTELSVVVRDVVNMLEPETEGRQVEWKIGELRSVECDPILVRQVFQNLIGNALKYSRRKSPAVIEIGQIQENGGPVTFVRDNGVGFSMKYADKLFGVFQRLHRAEDFEGTGVGLATVHRIIQKHGGRVWAEAEPDRGATFYFTLEGREYQETKATAAAGG